MIASSLSAAPYRGEGGSFEAYGAVAASFANVAIAIEACGVGGDNESAVKAAREHYRTRASRTCLYATAQIHRHALRAGSIAELKRFKKEIDTQLPRIQSGLAKQIRTLAQSPGWCERTPVKIGQGSWDLERVAARPLSTIFSTCSTDNESFIRGLVDGCIDKILSEAHQPDRADARVLERVLKDCVCAIPFVAYQVDIGDQARQSDVERSRVADTVRAGQTACLPE